MKMKALFLTCLMTGLLSMGAVAFAASSVSGDKVEYDLRAARLWPKVTWKSATIKDAPRLESRIQHQDRGRQP